METAASSEQRTEPNGETAGALPMVPHIEQYLGLWAMHEPGFLALLEQVNGMDLLAHIRSQQQNQVQVQAGQGSTDGRAAKPLGGERVVEPLYETVDGVAVIELAGVMVKYASSFSNYAGSVTLRRAVRQAVADAAVNSILLRVDSPGGTVAGTDDLANEVFAAGRAKPVVAFIEDMGASAAYYVASQAGRVLANPSGHVGSIGTYAVVYDYSEEFKKAGVKAHVIRAGRLKGAGVPGTEITAEQLAEWQRWIDQFYELFVAAVARGRGLNTEQALELADGRMHVGAAARKLGLIDGVVSFDDLLEQMQADHTMTIRAAAEAAEPVLEDRAMAGQAETVEVQAGERRAGLSRRRIIAEAKADYAAQVAGGGMICSELAHVNTALRDAGKRRLSEDEIRDLEIAGEEHGFAAGAGHRDNRRPVADAAPASRSAGDSAASEQVHGEGQDRQRRIIVENAKAEYAAAKAGGKVICSERAWVHTALRDRGQPPLSDAEIVRWDVAKDEYT